MVKQAVRVFVRCVSFYRSDGVRGESLEFLTLPEGFNRGWIIGGRRSLARPTKK